MKKRWMILVSLAAIAVMAFGALGTGAWFTDNAYITDNVITTGELSLKAWGGPLKAINLEPGAAYKPMGIFCAQNDGNYDLKFRGKLIDVAQNVGLLDYVQLRAILNPPGYVGTYNPGAAGLVVFTDVPFSSLMADNSYMDIKVFPMMPGEYACWAIEAKLLGTAPNEVQNAWVTAKLELHATQWIDPSY